MGSYQGDTAAWCSVYRALAGALSATRRYSRLVFSLQSTRWSTQYQGDTAAWCSVYRPLAGALSAKEIQPPGVQFTEHSLEHSVQDTMGLRTDHSPARELNV